MKHAPASSTPTSSLELVSAASLPASNADQKLSAPLASLPTLSTSRHALPTALLGTTLRTIYARFVFSPARNAHLSLIARCVDRGISCPMEDCGQRIAWWTVHLGNMLMCSIGNVHCVIPTA